jgi:hypothetical protein
MYAKATNDAQMEAILAGNGTTEITILEWPGPTIFEPSEYGQFGQR